MNISGRAYGGMADRQSNPIAEQGGVYIGAAYDISQKIALQRQNKQIGASLYGGAENEQVWNITPGGLLFTVPGSSSGSGHSIADAKMAVLECLNAQGATATARYANDPRAHDIIRLAVKNRIAFSGVAFQALEATRGNVERGITVQLAGLRTLPFGNGQFGEDMRDDNVCKPGDLLCVDVPVPGRAGLMPGAGSHQRRGVPDDRYTLQVRRCSPLSAGQNLVTHMHYILKDPAKWKVAMGERLNGTAAWASAASEVFNSYLTGGILFTRRLMAEGLVAPTTRGLLLASATSLKPLTDAATVANTTGDALSQKQSLDLSQAADLFAAHLAELLKVVDTRTYTKGLSNKLATGGPTPSDVAGRLRTLRMNVLQEIFYSGRNLAFEFGFAPGAANGRDLSLARFRNTGVVHSSETAGALLEAQLSHVQRATAGFHRAILDDQRFFLGKAATGATKYGSGNVHVFMSKTA